VRDLSIIGTPARRNRLGDSANLCPGEFDARNLNASAAARAINRGGHPCYVVPRITDLPEIRGFLKSKLPELTYLVAHGQMAAGELDDR